MYGYTFKRVTLLVELRHQPLVQNNVKEVPPLQSLSCNDVLMLSLYFHLLQH